MFRKPFVCHVASVLVGLAICWGGVSTRLNAQALGAITGTVTDPTGASVPRAKVTATESETSFVRTIYSDDSGHYTVPSLRPTDYTLTVEAQGFDKFVQQNIRLVADQTATIDVQLKIGATAETMTVTDVASTAPLVDAATPTLTEVVGTTRISELPLNGRAVAQLISLVPGAASASPTVVTSQSSLPGSVQASINGSRNAQTGYMLDGAPFLDQYYNTNIPFPFPDALQEFSVQTSNYSARYGGNAGGVVNVVTRSGGNSVHGGLFEFNRTLSYNAADAFTRLVDPLHRNDFGGTLGGPVYIPHLYNGRDKTFFFFGYQGTRYRQAAFNSALVPTDVELKGDFSAIPGAITDPLSNTVFPRNQIPVGRFDQASLNLTGYLPKATGTGFVYFPKPTNQDITTIVTRIDHQIGIKDRVVGRVYLDRIDLLPQFDARNLLGYSLGYHIPAENFMVQETHIFRPNLLNQASFIYSSVPVGKIAASDSPNMATFGVKGLWQPAIPFIQSIGVTGYFTVSGGAVGPFNASSFSWQDDVTWVHGRHDIALGGSLQRSRVDLGDVFQGPGSFTFTSDQVGNALAAFMIGKLRTFNQGAGEFKNNRNLFPAFYFADTWHALPRLTLTFGVRWEPYFPWDEIEGRVEQFRIPNFRAGIRSQMFPNAPPGLLFPGDPGMPSRGTTGTMSDIAPRVGFAYAPGKDSKMSIRGGFGMFYDTQTAGVINNRFADLSPFSPQLAITSPAGPFSNPALGITDYPFPAPYPPPKNSIFPAPVLSISYDPTTNFRVPVTYNWNFTVERQFAQNWLLQVAYVGAHSSHGKETVNLNPSLYIPGSSLGTDQRRIFQGYAAINMDSQSGNSSYNSLQVAVKKRLSYGVTVNLAYTYSKALDDFPNGGGNADIGSDSSSAMPWYFANGRVLDRGPSGSDHRQRIVISGVWMLPRLAHTNHLARAVLGEWQLSSIMTAQTGDPLSVTAGYDRSLTGLGNDRANLVLGQSVYNSNVCGATFNCISWLNPAAFSGPKNAGGSYIADGNFGNVGKGALRGPGSIVFDAGLSKNFTLHESWKVQLRGEFFNAMNHVNPNNPNTAVNNAQFGKITGVGTPRVGQLALKLTF
jgi:Carboxypeptidase regulatory-like domain/TonB-dependent Receptor Plug Domain